ncbi:biliverdin-producing heme oxygenase [Tunturiibacter lichenicola]|jgi:heme oxygenase|uniref:biliverdin-producing heme oxygenase n=1 Tax=Tunturiibacter lichenicola TaxID=2051959 RepID=UPI003D9BABDA
MDLERLRLETSAAHNSVEQAIPLMGREFTSKEYISCLRRIQGIVGTWEQVAVNSPIGWVRELVVERQRCHLLDQDLRFFGISEINSERPVLPRMNDEASLLGTMYVMEGSKLGGKLIARHVQNTLELTSGNGTAFFRDHGRQTGLLWKQFCDILRVRVTDPESGQVIESAKEMFRVFGSWVNHSAYAHNSTANLSIENARANI